MLGPFIAYLAGAATLTPLSIAAAVFIVATAIGALVGYGIAKIYEKVNQKKEQNPNMDTWVAIKSVLYETTPEYLKGSCRNNEI